jgi:hypothetical protein
VLLLLLLLVLLVLLFLLLGLPWLSLVVLLGVVRVIVDVVVVVVVVVAPADERLSIVGPVRVCVRPVSLSAREIRLACASPRGPRWRFSSASLLRRRMRRLLL